MLYIWNVGVIVVLKISPFTYAPRSFVPDEPCENSAEICNSDCRARDAYIVLSLIKSIEILPVIVRLR